MKKIIPVLLLLLFGTIVVCGCTGATDPVVGKWERTTMFGVTDTFVVNSDGTFKVTNSRTDDITTGNWMKDNQTYFFKRDGDDYYYNWGELEESNENGVLLNLRGTRFQKV